MKRLWRFPIPLILISVVTLSALQQDSRANGEQTKTDSGWSELGASMQRMHAAMASTEPSGDSDVDFVRLMLPHHQAAIDMAKTQLLNGNDPQMRRLAQEIITDQQSEIELMQHWMKQHESGLSGTGKAPAAKSNQEER
jgi:uncharacterized protein (DUF305 family)